MIYHILSEAEPFSEHFGGALSRWAANVLRGDDNATIVCPWADSTWGFAPSKIWAIPNLRRYLTCTKFLRSRFAIGSRLIVLRQVFRPLVDKLRAGDTIYIHNRPEFDIALSPICRRKGVHIVLHLQNSHLLAVLPRYRPSLDADALVFCSEFLKTEARHCVARARRAVVIPNGADENCFFPGQKDNSTENGTPIVLFVGRLVPEKGVHIFIDALRLLKEKGLEVCGRIIGSIGFGTNSTSPYLDRLKRSKPENVEFGSYVSGTGVAEEFRRATIFCCPSVWDEPFGMVNVEAMASALPVVASAVGGIPEIFRDGGGILVPGGSAGEFATALELLIMNPPKRREFAAQGYQSYQKRYRWPQIRQQYDELMQFADCGS